MRWLALTAAALLVGCAEPPAPEAPKPPPVVAPASAPALEQPPPSGPERAFRIPKPTWLTLKNGVRVATITDAAAQKGLPLVHVRVAILTGKAADGEKPGLLGMTAEMLKDGGAGKMSGKALVERVESLGSSLGIQAGFDETVFSMSVTKDALADAVDLLGAVITSPQLSSLEFDKLKKRELDRTSDATKSGGWSAQMVLYRELFSLPTDHHPYASFDALPSEVPRVGLADVRAAYKRYYVPKNIVVVIAGNVTPAEANRAAERAFGGLRGGDAPLVSYPEPDVPARRRIVLVDRPRSSQSDVYVGALGVERGDKRWAEVAMMNQVLGGGPPGRLFRDVREKQSLAYTARSELREFAHAPGAVVAYAGTQTAKTGLALQGLLDEVARLQQRAPDDEEVETARRYLTDTFAIKLGTMGAVADELVRLIGLELPDDYDDRFRREIRGVTGALVYKAAGDHLKVGHEIIVVSGDARVVGPMLSHFGDVKIVDAARGFDRSSNIAMNPSAPLEVAREKGK